MTAIGIDLGTTYSCVGALQHGKVEIIANEQGSRTTPSCVAFSATERLVGDAARAQAALNPRNTVFDAKRLIGRKFDDPKVQEDLKHWPFQVVDDGGNPKIQVEYKGNTLCFPPEEISSMILSKMKSFAEAYLDEEVKEAVITVPAYFNDAQRQATKEAGTIAGLTVMRIINEPTAAALAYGLEKDLKGERNVLIFDLGGGTFDVSILKITEGSHFEVKSTAGDTHLGGEDFNNKLVEFFACQFERKHKKNLRNSPKALCRLRTAAERAKRTLSTSTEASIDIDSLFDGIDFVHKISRARFEELNSEFFNSTLVQVENALNDAKFNKSDIHDIVLVGGSTRIPKVQSILQNYFNGKKLNLSINPDEAVAYGATVQAAILTGVGEAKIQDLVLVDVLPLSLGIEMSGGIMSKIIKRNTKIPCKITETYYTVIDNQTTVNIIVCEGERAMAKDNEKLGLFMLYNIPPAPKGHEKIDVCFYINSDSILQVSAKVRSTGKKAQITIEHNKGRLSQAQIQRMVADAKRYQYEDNQERERVNMKNKLEDYVYQVKHALVNQINKLKEDDVSVIRNKCEEVIRWLDSNATADKEDFENEMQKLKNYCDPFMKNINGAGHKTHRSAYGIDIEEVD